MQVIFCSDPFDSRTPDPDYDAEAQSAESMGVELSLISYEALVNEGDALRATRKVPLRTEPELAIYRGWMLAPQKYEQLYQALLSRGLRLINDPSAYKHCHYFPESYALIERHTPKSIWTDISSAPSIDDIMELLKPFGAGPIIVKDFVKSRKHEWEEACYIPSASDISAVERVVNKFVELQGEDLSGGLVFREFVEFEPLTVHSKSGMPLTKEFRTFFLDGQPLLTARYWEEGDYGQVAIHAPELMEVAKSVRSRFFTMDIAKQTDGGWMIVELGDAQVAGLPETVDAAQFYEALVQHWPKA